MNILIEVNRRKTSDLNQNDPNVGTFKVINIISLNKKAKPLQERTYVVTFKNSNNDESQIKFFVRDLKNNYEYVSVHKDYIIDMMKDE